jgi:EmrB/QacA subfamily drug resistance transporter
MSTAIAAPCDGGTAAAQSARRCPHQSWTLAASILASSLAFVDGSVVNVGLPAIGRSLAADAAGLQWIVNAYLLPLSALLLLGGAAGDRFGRRRLFLIGTGLFALASLLCAAAPTLPLLLAGRMLQGASAAMLMPNSLAILGAAFAGEARGRAIGTWAAAGAVAGAIGPLLGGWLIAAVGWRSIFLINLPLALAALAIAWYRVEESREANRHSLDWLGVAVATAALAAITWGLTLLSARTGSAAAGTAFAAGGLAAFLLFLRIEQKRGERAIMPLGLFGTASFTGLTLLTFFLYAALGGLFVLLPFVLMELEGYSPIEAGAALLPLPAAIGLGSRFMGALAARTGPRLPLILGPLVAAAGFALYGFPLRHRRASERRQVDALQRSDRDRRGAGGELSVLHDRAECRPGRRARSAARQDRGDRQVGAGDRDPARVRRHRRPGARRLEGRGARQPVPRQHPRGRRDRPCAALLRRRRRHPCRGPDRSDRRCETVETELMLADLDSLEKRVPNLVKKAQQGDKEAKVQASVLGQALELLRDSKPARLTQAEG